MFASSFGKNRTSDLPPFLAKGQISLANVSKPRFFFKKATKAAEIRKAENPDKSKVFGVFAGVPGGIRTHGLSLRRRTLYPAELQRLILN